MLVLRVEGEKALGESGRASEKLGHFIRTLRSEWKMAERWGKAA